ncbi:MAG: prepilin peptidase [candidate division WOR-3 bacterium]
MKISFLFFLFGLIIGSFLNVCIYRIPRKISIAFPPSFCPNCKKRIRPYDNIPVLSYLLLGGRCRYCRKRISPIYPIVEFLTGITFYLLYLKLSLSFSLFISLVYFSLLLLTAFLDWQEKATYDLIIYLGVIFGFLFNLKNPIFSLIGILVGAFTIFLFRLLGFLWRKKEMMGTGDIFLGGMIGSLLGWQFTLLVIFLGAFFGVLISSILIALKVWKRDSYIPFCSFLSLATGLVFFFGDKILDLYLNFFRFRAG